MTRAWSVEVRREDQMNINKFSACNRKMQEQSSGEAVLKQDLQNLQDATDKLRLDCIYLKSG